jgi:hypothetical protein
MTAREVQLGRRARCSGGGGGSGMRRAAAPAPVTERPFFIFIGYGVRGNFVHELFPKSSKHNKIIQKGKLDSHQSKVWQISEVNIIEGKS